MGLVFLFFGRCFWSLGIYTSEASHITHHTAYVETRTTSTYLPLSYPSHNLSTSPLTRPILALSSLHTTAVLLYSCTAVHIIIHPYTVRDAMLSTKITRTIRPAAQCLRQTTGRRMASTMPVSKALPGRADHNARRTKLVT